MNNATRSSRILDLTQGELAVVRRNVLSGEMDRTWGTTAQDCRVLTFAEEIAYPVELPDIRIYGSGATERAAGSLVLLGRASVDTRGGPSTQSSAELAALEEIRSLTGADWAEIASWLDVSRVSVNNWRTGSEIAAPNRQRLHRLLRIIRIATSRVPSDLSSWLHAPVAGGSTPSEMLRQGQFDQAEAMTRYVPEPPFVSEVGWEGSQSAEHYVTRAYPTSRRASSQRRRRPVLREDDDFVLEEEPEILG